MMSRLKALLANKVDANDDGFVFMFAGHGTATALKADDGVEIPYQEIMDAISANPLLAQKPKLLVFDCCQVTGSAGQSYQGVAIGPRDQLSLPKETLVARSTGVGTQAFEKIGFGSVYSARLADNIRNHAASHMLEQLLKRTQGAVHSESTPSPQIAHVDSSLGAYDLFLGPGNKRPFGA